MKHTHKHFNDPQFVGAMVRAIIESTGSDGKPNAAKATAAFMATSKTMIADGKAPSDGLTKATQAQFAAVVGLINAVGAFADACVEMNGELKAYDA
jgi:hypothetical protein